MKIKRFIKRAILLCIVFSLLFLFTDKYNKKKNTEIDRNFVNQSDTNKKTATNSDSPLENPRIPEPQPNIVKPEEPIKPKLVKEINGFVSLASMDENLVLDLKYATIDNFTGKIVYPVDVCLLRKETAQKLVQANAELKKVGYYIKVWDAYRPMYVQKIFWDIVKDDRFVANPATGGSRHNRGTAVDITLVDFNGKELKMPSKFDDFSTNAYRTNEKMDPEVKKNLNILTEVMKRNGFTTIDTEWWHFDDANSSNYKIEDVNLNSFLIK